MRDNHLVLRQRSRLIGTYHRCRSQGLDCLQILYQAVFVCHSLCSKCQWNLCQATSENVHNHLTSKVKYLFSFTTVTLQCPVTITLRPARSYIFYGKIAHLHTNTPCPSKFDTLLSNVITLSNIGRFSNFFQHFNRHEIWDKTAVEVSHRP